jgi:hypothetical protein
MCLLWASSKCNTSLGTWEPWHKGSRIRFSHCLILHPKCYNTVIGTVDFKPACKQWHLLLTQQWLSLQYKWRYLSVMHSRFNTIILWQSPSITNEPPKYWILEMALTPNSCLKPVPHNVLLEGVNGRQAAGVSVVEASMYRSQYKDEHSIPGVQCENVCLSRINVTVKTILL